MYPHDCCDALSSSQIANLHACIDPCTFEQMRPCHWDESISMSKYAASQHRLGQTSSHNRRAAKLTSPVGCRIQMLP
jgi:hypothetical protein